MRTFEDDDPLFAPMLNALFAAFRGTAVMSGCAPSATGADRVVTVTAGSVQIGGVTVAVAGGTVTLDAGGETDRYDLVTVDATGALVATKGTGVRKCPAQPADTCLIAIVFIPAGATVIATGDVYDARMDALRLSVLNIDADKNWNGKNITNVGRLSSSAARYLLSAAPASAEYRIANKSASVTATGQVAWYNFGPSYTIPTSAGPRSTVLLDVVRVGGDSDYLRVTKNGEPVPDGLVDVEPGDIFQAEYQNAMSRSYTITWSLYAFEAPLFPPGTTE